MLERVKASEHIHQPGRICRVTKKRVKKQRNLKDEFKESLSQQLERRNIHFINPESVKYTADVKCWLNKWINESPKADTFHSEILPYFDFAENTNRCWEIHT